MLARTIWAFAIAALIASSQLQIELHARGSGTARIAAILLEFVHVPSMAQRDELRSIVDSSTTDPALRSIAFAVLRVVHTPHPDDVPVLKRLAANRSQATAIRTLAGIVSRLVHVPGAADRIELKGLSRPDSQCGPCV